jgi:hypothetical protein
MLFGCSLLSSNNIEQIIIVDEDLKQSLPQTYSLLHYEYTENHNNEYTLVIHTYDVFLINLEQGLLVSFEASNITKSYFDMYSMIIISFGWGDTQENFTIGSLSKNSENKIDLVIDMLYDELVGYPYDRRVLVIEVGKGLIGSATEVNHTFNVIEVKNNIDS